VTKVLGFCSRCGADLSQEDRFCRCCGNETYDANVVTLLKRTSARRSRRGTVEETDDSGFPL
jgi:predicted amidophosphoribosyltransferase